MEVSVRQACQTLSRLINQVIFEKRPIIITARGKSKAVLMSIEEYERLTNPEGIRAETLETAQRLREALEAEVGVLQEDWVAEARTEHAANLLPGLVSE
ncbi:MAG: type II toxin-antitoxin system Phd/YefM family antitoxin [Anaerolineae bacterium]|nr:type II toxin-antitoxin system Phd/YefM family antitoxin [Anaerolineae bacterium]